MWYRVGTAAFVNGSTTVTGTGTDWLIGANVGDGLLAPDGKIYEVVSVVSTTSLTITPAYTGSTLSGQAYASSPTQSFLRDLAAQVSTLVNDYSTVKNTVGAARFADGTVTEPGIKFDADVNTGIRRVSADTMALVAGGVDQVTVSTSGVTGVTKAMVGLSNVDNTTDANKPVSTAQAAAIVTERTTAATLTNKTINLTSNTLVATSAQLAAALTDETGTGAAVFATSPALAGTPTAPTAAVGTNTTQLATTAFVAGTTASQAAIAATLKPSLSVDWTQKPTAAALTAAGWTISRTGEITSFGMPTKAAENLFTDSQNFANWIASSFTLSAVTDESGLAGSLIVQNSGAGGPTGVRKSIINTNIGSANYRIRYLCKAAGYTKCAIGETSAARHGARFNLATGQVIDTSGADAGATATSGYGGGYIRHSIAAHELGGGLYWCEIELTSTAAGGAWTPSIVGYPDAGATFGGGGAAYTGDGTSGIEVYAAQLQQGFDGDYIPTTTDPITIYEPGLVTTAANELAYQHNASGECIGLVQYPGDTNLILQSQNFGSASWTTTGIATGTVPTKRMWAGNVPFWRLAKANTTSFQSANQSIATSVAAGAKYSVTLALLADRWSGNSSVTIGIAGPGVANSTWGANVDGTAAILSGPGTVTQGSGVRFDVTGLSVDVPTLVRVTRTFPNADTGVSVLIYPGLNTSTTLGAAILATRVHLSASPRMMPYIPTTTAAVTRGSQILTFGGSAFAAVDNPAQGTFLVKASVEDAVFDVSRQLALLQTNTAYNAINRIGFANSGATSTLQAYASTFNVTVFNDGNIGSISTTPQTVALSFSKNAFTPAMNGVVDVTDTVGEVPPVDKLQIGWNTSVDAAYLIQRTEIYPRAMTSAELAAITTPGVL